MRLGGFVIHGDAADTLEPCLEDLCAVCDEVVAVDSGSTDGSEAVVARHPVRRVVHPWEGYGAARAVAVEALAGCDWVFFLDADERLGPGGREAMRRWRDRAEQQAADFYRVVRRDRADIGGRRFLYRRNFPVRMYRQARARWSPRMIVHEALDARGALYTDVPVDHRFATTLDGLREKQARYALLWALRADAEGARSKTPAFQRPVHALRDLLAKGALWRGGWTGARLAWSVSAYHADKYRRLAELRAGKHGEARRAFAEERYGDLFEIVRRG